MDIKFTKLQGAGNDYIAIDGRNFDHDWGQLSLEMSKPAFGVGSDGIVVVKNSDIAQIRMLVFNPYGTEAEMSGNCIRLFSKFVIDNNLLTLDEALVKTEEDKLQAEYDALEYQRQRKREYPTIEELVVALYDTDDKADIETKRAAVKAKYPKPA